MLSSSTSTRRVAFSPAPRPAKGRIALLMLGGLCLLSGLDAALLLLGVWAPVGASHLPGLHGMVMTLGFMGTVIALERAQSLGKSWAYIAPALIAAASLSLVAGIPQVFGKMLLVQGYVVFTAVYIALWRRAPVTGVVVQVLSGVMALCAAILWVSITVESLIILLAAFIVLTIAAERAELAQLTMGPKASPRLLGLSTILVVAALLTLLTPAVGARAFGVAVLGFVVWLVRDDVVGKFIRAQGLRRYNATALLAGYLWLGAAGLSWAVVGLPTVQWAYDITIHGTFLGFGVSMIMAHAPIIFPAVLGRPLPYKPISWLPLLLLHLGMVLRVVGDLSGITLVWRTGSVVNVVAMLVFLIVSVILVVTHRAADKRS
ncbi:hypothetical protein [Propionibacterium sp. oral taxon 192]|uniref:hypothetical protein n=1 Tax=Propionibacterium sp. oral taxon 192 TaxID=671222 RepID=UPI0018DE6846|nr:hypothetical protein [Propionibacterium sp. oral taxon 192]